MRLFFALPLAPSSADAIEDWRERNLPHLCGRVPQANFHITLAFLGQTPATKMETLCASAESLFCDECSESFTLTIDTFAYWSKAGVSWIGPQSWPEQLAVWNRKLSRHASQTRKGKKAYQPHVTISRSHEPPPRPLHEPDIRATFSAASLYQSVPAGDGVRYEELETWGLRPARAITGPQQRAPARRRAKEQNR